VAALRALGLLIVLTIGALAATTDLADHPPGTLLPAILIHEDRTAEHNQTSIVNAPWQKETRSNIGHRPHPVWTRVTLTNSSDRPLHLLLSSPRPGIDRIDLAILRDNQPVQHYQLGDRSPSEGKPILSRYSTIELSILPGESYTLMSRIESIGPIEVSWRVENTASFAWRSLLENLFLGLFVGTVIGLIIYNGALYLSLRYHFFIFYILLAIASLLNQAAIHNLLVVLPGPWITELLNQAVYFTSVSVLTLPLLFAMSFFNTRATMPRLHRTAYGPIALAVSAVVLLYTIGPGAVRLLSLIVPPLMVAMTFTIAIRAVYLGKTGAIYFLIGQVFLSAAFSIQILSFQPEVLPLSMEAVFLLVPLGTVLDIFFLSLAQHRLIMQLRKERELYRLAAASKSRFGSIGKSIGNMIHQWKVPLVRLGSQVALLETKRRFATPDAFYESSLESLSELKKGVADMKAIAKEFGSFYRTDHRPERFGCKALIDETIKILQTRIDEGGIRIHKEIPADLNLHGFRSALAHVVMILLDNAIEVLSERKRAYPRIHITARREGGQIKLTIEDNGGGIQIVPIESIFEGFVSDKHDRHSSGAGLMIAQMLTTERLSGTLRATNTESGACFEVVLPQLTGG
jgi:signal transduction histidine kinase